MQIGIVGLQYSGKTTFFQTLTETHLDANALQKKETNQAVVKVIDKRLDLLTEMFNPKKKVNATIEIVDLVGVQKTDTKGSSFTSAMINKIKTNDALIHVVRGFENDILPHPDGSINLIRDINNFEEEMIFADMAFLESRMEKLEKDIMKQKIKEQALKEKEIMLEWQEHLNNGHPLRTREFTSDE